MTTLSGGLEVASHIQQLIPYVPGKTTDEVQRELGLTDIIKLASNENPLGPSPAAIDAIRKAAELSGLYPEGNAPKLREAVARHLDVLPDNLIFGNGSDEVLHLLAVTFLQPGDETVQGDPSFAMYEIYARQCNATPVKVALTGYTHDLDAMLANITSRTRIVFIANPNNPTGTLVTGTAVERFMDRVPENVLVVLDEAYDEYVEAEDKPRTPRYVAEGRNVAVLRTFSKAYGLAGLRVGYGIARPEITELLARVRSPFNVNLIGQAAATAGLGDQEHIRRSVEVNAAGRRYLYAEFARLGLDCVPSEANFVLADVSGRKATDWGNIAPSRVVFERLQRLGVIIRPGAGLGLPGHIRVTVGTQSQNERFIAALEEVLAS
jgi:histidinol-phosphate aminotransferase